MRDKVYTYLGFAARSRNIVTGYNTCLMMLAKRKLRLLIVCEDVAENTKKKMLSGINKYKTEYRIFGKMDDLSQITGKPGKGVFGITDDHFAEIICKEIDRIQSEKEGSNDEKST